QHLVEACAHIPVVVIEAFTVEDLDQEVATRAQYPGRHVQCQLAQIHGTRLIHSRCTTHVGGHIGNNKVNRLTADRGKDLLEHLILGEIALDEGDIRYAVHRQYVGRDDTALLADQAAGHLTPTSGGGAQVDHRHAGTQQAVLLLDFQ